MKATVRKWGNSLALRIPRPLADQTHLVDGSTVTLEVEGASIRISPSPKKYDLAELLAGHKPAAEVDWGRPEGEEAW